MNFNEMKINEMTILNESLKKYSNFLKRNILGQ